MPLRVNFWTEQQVSDLVRLWRDEAPIEQIIGVTQHSAASIHDKVYRLRTEGYSLPKQPRGVRRGQHHPVFEADEGIRVPDNDPLLWRLWRYHDPRKVSAA